MHQWIARAALLPALVLILVACGTPSAAAPTAAPEPEAESAATAAPAATGDPAPPATAVPSLPTATPAAPTATATPAAVDTPVPATTGEPTATPAALSATTVPPALTATPTPAGLGAAPVPTEVPPASLSPAAGSAKSPHIERAVADLAARLGVDPGAISVVRAEELDWPDGSLGCPQEGMGYTQALVNGYFVQLEAGGQLYNYHGRAGGEPFLCTAKGALQPEDVAPSLRGGGGDT